MMNRRHFLTGSAAMVAGSLGYARCFGQAGPPALGESAVAGTLEVDLNSSSHLIPLNYNGLSYELAQLTDPNFFAATNQELISLFRQLSPQGVLRLGGNSSESCWFKADASVTAPEFRPAAGPASENWMPNQLFVVTPEAVDHLADFMKATGWQLIYGLSFGHNTPERAAREAEYVASKVGEQLLYFQIGNEPDFYHNTNNKTRPANWGFADYLEEWKQCADAISQRAPRANFGGPDVGSSSNWIPQFIRGASEKLGSHLATVTGHYYAEGPPDDPKVTTARLLATNPTIARRTKSIVDAAAKDKLVYRMTEGNSCYRGGKPGMSDAFAAALWAGDYMLALASAGCAGVNLHGGSRSVLRAALGNHMPGELVARESSDTKGGYYTPIAGELGQGFQARPIFYGMVLANQLAGKQSKEVALTANAVNATAYAGEKDGQVLIAIFNKDDAHDLRLSLQMPPDFHRAKLWRLTAPALDSTSRVTLAGSEVSAKSTWSPKQVETPAVKNDGLIVELPKASAALVFLER
jgi:hypothetical protein